MNAPHENPHPALPVPACRPFGGGCGRSHGPATKPGATGRRALPFLFAALAAVALTTGCSLRPVRVFEATVPAPLEVTPKQREAWAAGADFVAGAVEAPAEAVQVADALSDSIGAPARPLEEAEVVVDALRAARAAEVRARVRQDDRLRELEGKTIEGTGLNLTAWGGGLGLAAIVAACIFVPGVPTVLWLATRSSARVAGQMVRTVREVGKTDPETAKRMKDALDRMLDARDKAEVDRIKSRLR